MSFSMLARMPRQFTFHFFLQAPHEKDGSCDSSNEADP
jgi:hypothetical protein